MERAGITRQQANDFCREILPAVSRTFALSIRLLPGELGAAVRCAYLICRIADTLEDEPSMPAESKAALLDLLATCFDDARSVEAFGDASALVAGDPAHVRLVRNSDLVFAAYRALPSERATSFSAGSRNDRRNAKVRRRTSARRPIQSLEEYKEYRYYVAEPSAISSPILARALAEYRRASICDPSRPVPRIRRGAPDGEHPQRRGPRRRARELDLHSRATASRAWKRARDDPGPIARRRAPRSAR
jgi:phytoene/squalene synthetase